jgi:hypothetical protein
MPRYDSLLSQPFRRFGGTRAMFTACILAMERRLLNKQLGRKPIHTDIEEGTEMSPSASPSNQSVIKGRQGIPNNCERNPVVSEVMPDTPVVSATLDAASYHSDYTSSLEEQIIRLHSMVAQLLKKNEELRLFIARQCEKGDTRRWSIPRQKIAEKVPCALLGIR